VVEVLEHYQPHETGDAVGSIQKDQENKKEDFGKGERGQQKRIGKEIELQIEPLLEEGEGGPKEAGNGHSQPLKRIREARQAED
jgi:hypothetical protein